MSKGTCLLEQISVNFQKMIVEISSQRRLEKHICMLLNWTERIETDCKVGTCLLDV